MTAATKIMEQRSEPGNAARLSGWPTLLEQDWARDRDVGTDAASRKLAANQQETYGNSEVARVAARSEPAEIEAKASARDALPSAGIRTTPRPITTPLPAPVEAALRTPSEPLTPTQRERMEAHVGSSLEHVRLHHSRAAAASAPAIGARAYASGADVVFGPGEYKPGTPEGDALLKEELTHVVQHEDGDQTYLSADLTGGSGASAGVAGPGTAPTPPAPATSSTQAPVLTQPVELRNHPQFDPPVEVAKRIKDAMGLPVWVAVKYGSIGTGEIPVCWTPFGYQTPPPPNYYPGHAITLRHPAFPRIPNAAPSICVNVTLGKVTGSIGWVTPLWVIINHQFSKVFPTEKLFGLKGFSEVDAPQSMSELSGGQLSYESPTMSFKIGDFSGNASLRLYDETFDFAGDIDVPVKGLPSDARVPLKAQANSALNAIFGTRTWSFSRSLASGAKISAQIIATLGEGLIDVRGTGKYTQANPAISGTVTLLITSFDRAKEAVRDRLGPDAPADIQPAVTGEKLAITGWGQLDFALSEWLTGNAEVIVHPEGYVTARGEIVPTKIIKLAKKVATEQVVFEKQSAEMPLVRVPGWGDIAAEGSVGPLKAHASFGAATLHDLRVSGLLSNHPSITHRFELAGIVSAPATAGLSLQASATVKAKLLHVVEILSAGVTVEGNLQLNMLAEAGIQAGRRAGAAGVPEYYIEGDVNANAQLVLDLRLWFDGSILVWRGHIKAYERTFPLGTYGAGLHFDMALNKNGESKVAADFSRLDLNSKQFRDKFMAAVVRSETVEKKGYKGSTDVDGETDVVIQPAAPIAPTPEDPGERGRDITHVLRRGFTMLAEPHMLTLRLSAQPTLEMASDPPAERLKKRIARARSYLKKQSENPEETRAQLGELSTIENVADQVLEGAAKVARAPDTMEVHVPGFDQLAELAHNYGEHFQETDLVPELDGGGVAPTPSDPPKHAAGRLALAKASFGNHFWIRQELQDLLKLQERMAREVIRGWISGKELFVLQTSMTDPFKVYTFDEARAGERPLADTESNRSKYGFTNPGHDSPAGRTILIKGIRPGSPPPSDPASRYDSMRGGTRAMPPSKFVNFPRTIARLGHGPVGASEFWNDGKPVPGHKQSYEQNKKWNFDPVNYWGPEHKDESDASGGSSPRYLVPMKAIESHPDWW